MVCNNCKNEISDTALYCPICGTAVKAAEIPQPASQEQGYQEQIPSQIPEPVSYTHLDMYKRQVLIPQWKYSQLG